jgi:hypothetical protein
MIRQLGTALIAERRQIKRQADGHNGGNGAFRDYAQKKYFLSVYVYIHFSLMMGRWELITCMCVTLFGTLSQTYNNQDLIIYADTPPN